MLERLRLCWNPPKTLVLCTAWNYAQQPFSEELCSCSLSAALEGGGLTVSFCDCLSHLPADKHSMYLYVHANDLKRKRAKFFWILYITAERSFVKMKTCLILKWHHPVNNGLGEPQPNVSMKTWEKKGFAVYWKYFFYFIVLFSVNLLWMAWSVSCCYIFGEQYKFYYCIVLNWNAHKSLQKVKLSFLYPCTKTGRNISCSANRGSTSSFLCTSCALLFS